MGVTQFLFCFSISLCVGLVFMLLHVCGYMWSAEFDVEDSLGLTFHLTY